jgi:hypothetical protein
MRASSTAAESVKLGHHVPVRPSLVAAVALALLLPAGAPTATGSGLWGVVRRGPITPVCMEGTPCSEPAPNVTLVFTRNGREAARVITRRDGRYRLALRPGIYGVRTLQKPAIGRGLKPTRAVVPAGRLARVDFTIDTGIR